jgi:hypothetical protein
MPVRRWHDTNNVTAPHIGPMAQDFYAAFGLGEDDKPITTLMKAAWRWRLFKG